MRRELKCIFMAFSIIMLSTEGYPFFYRDLNLKFVGKVAGVYDDNVNFSREKKGDYITKLDAGVNLRLESKRRSLQLDGLLSQSIYSRESTLNNTSGNLNLSFRNEFTEYDRVTMNNYYTRSYVPWSFEEEISRITGRFKSESNTFNLNYERDISKDIILKSRYQNVINEYTDGDFNKSNLNSFGFDIGYQYSPYTNFSFLYEFSKINYEGNGGRSLAHTFSLGLGHYISKRIYSTGQMGIDLIKNFGNKQEVAEYINFSIISEPTKNTKLNFGFTKRKLTAFEGKDQKGDSLSISVISNLTGNTSLNAGFTRNKLNYIDREEIGHNFNVGLKSEVAKKIPFNINFNKNTSSTYTEIWNSWQALASLGVPGVFLFNERLNTLFSCFYGDAERAFTDEEVTLWGITTDLSYDLTKNLKGRLGYSFSDLRRNIRTNPGYTRNVISIELTTNF